MVIERGQIYWCALDPIQGHEQGAPRPVIVVSADPYNKTQSPLAAVVPLTKAAARTSAAPPFLSGRNPVLGWPPPS